MKKLLAFVLSFSLLSPVLGQKSEFQKLIGRWEISTQDHEKAFLEIIDSANIYLTYEGQRKKCQDPQVNFSKSPYWFDFSTSDGDSTIRIKSLVEIFDNDIIRWQLFVDEERAPHFTAARGEIMYLKRSRPAVLTAANTQ